MKSSQFKYKTQLFEMNHLLYTAYIQRDLINGEYRPGLGIKFPVRQRGKARFITSNSMADKTVNHVISDHYLTPLLKKYLIHDNDASQKEKGVGFHRKRFKKYLRNYFLTHGNNDGYILLVDFSGYYCNIPHSKCAEVLNNFINKEIKDPEEREILKDIIKRILKTFRVDVSRFTDEEIEKLRVGKVDPQMNVDVPQSLMTGEKFLDKGVEIGNQVSQNVGIVYPYKLDNYAKIVRGVKRYARYTDDFYAISENKEFLKSLLEGFKEIADEFGLRINERKTRIVKLSSFYRHLKDGYSLTDTGKILCKIHPQSITRERRKLKAYKRLMERKIVPYSDIENIFRSWMGANWKRMSHRQIHTMYELYINLFRRKPKWKRICSRLRWLMEHQSKT